MTWELGTWIKHIPSGVRGYVNGYEINEHPTTPARAIRDGGNVIAQFRGDIYVWPIGECETSQSPALDAYPRSADA